MERLHPSFEPLKNGDDTHISHHMIFNRSILKSLFTMVEEHHNKVFWRAFLECVSPDHRPGSGATEYEIYYQYINRFFNDKVKLRRIKFENSGEPIMHALCTKTNNDLGYIAIHSWIAGRNSNNLNNNRRNYRINMISGEAFQCLCETTVITREIEMFHSSLSPSVKKVYLEDINAHEKLNNSKSIFVYTHILDRFISEILPKLNNKFILITHNSDHSINEKYLTLLNDERIVHMFSQNTFIEHPKLTALPIGIANSMWHHGQKSSIENVIKNSKNFTSRKERIYVNVSEETNYAHRSKVIGCLKNNELCDIISSNRPHPVYLEEMSGYKWVASPKGNGVDCHRLWECMYAGSIAICDDSVNARAFRDMGLPIILIGDPSVDGSLSSVGWNNITLEWLQEETKKLVPVYRGTHDIVNLNWWKNKFDSYLDNEGCFVLVYIGVLRNFVYECVKQIRLWNPTQKIYLCINNNEQNKPFVESIKDFNVILSYIEDLSMTEDHKRFNKNYTNLGMNGFWKYTMERFFIVEECMRKHNLKNIFHLEIDNMVYFKVDEILNKCKAINKILIPSDNETRYIAGTCFINDTDNLSLLNKFFSDRGNNRAEMEVIREFTLCNLYIIDSLPVIPSEYSYPLNPMEGIPVRDPNRLKALAPFFEGVFDAAALGQFLGGIDPIHNPGNTDGFINPHPAFTADKLTFKWEKVDGLQRLNMSVDKEHWYPVYNLHIHNKNLKRWMSDLPEMTKHLPNII